MRRYIIKSNLLENAENYNIIEQVVRFIQRNEIVTLEMNAVNNETNNTLKQSSNSRMKSPATKNEQKKLENRQFQTEKCRLHRK